MKFRIPAPISGSAPFDIKLPTIGLSLTVTPRWSVADPQHFWWCGAELTDTDPRVTRAWHRLVDSVH
jgi:hypothetical protein